MESFIRARCLPNAVFRVSLPTGNIHLDMFNSGAGGVVLSVGDLIRAGRCEFALLNEVDRLLGRRDHRGAADLDSAWRKMLQLGNQHERNVLEQYRRAFGRDRVIEIPRVRERTRDALHHGFERTLAALKSDSVVVYQAVVFDGAMLGYADFLVRDQDGRWRIEDAKLTAASSDEARMQVAAYASLFGTAGVELSDDAAIVLGDGTTLEVHLEEVVPAFANGRARTHSLVERHVASGTTAQWDPRTTMSCGRCEDCTVAIEAHRDVLLVDGVGMEERTLFLVAGIHVVDQLAEAEQAPAGMSPAAFHRLRRRSALRLAPGRLPNMPAFDVVREDLLGRVPKENPGDLFLSFAAQGRFGDDEGTVDHLFTVTSVDGVAQTYWGDDPITEAQSFLRFLADVDARRRQHPAMHVHHYSPVDRPHLIDLAERAGAGREQVDALIESGVLVDLFPVVNDALLVGSKDRSLREVGRLADPELAERLSTADSAAQRAEHRRLVRQGDDVGATNLRSLIERENVERALLTKRLREWLLDLMVERGVQPGSVAVPRRGTRAESELVRALRQLAQGGSSSAHALASAALEYHALEASVFWRAHERRRHRHTTEWATRTRGAARVDQHRVGEDWVEGERGGRTRLIRLRLTTSPGTTLRVEDQPFLVYDGRPVFDDETATPGARSVTSGEVLERTDDEVLIRERMPKGAVPWTALPSAIAPSRPPHTSAIESAIRQWASGLLEGGALDDPATDLVLRRDPRLTTGALSRVKGIDGRVDVAASLVASLEALDRSFLAVQGPPGSGKTTVGARVIADLVRRGWKIGIVAQSHAVVEHFLEQVVRADAPVERVAKHAKSLGVGEFTRIGKDGYRTFMREHADGFVVGGTAWTFTNPRRIPSGALDLLVIDEAGQFGLVNAIAVSQAARNLLLLGDPQQLPQVSQAVHRASADSSALGWLLDGAAVLPERYGWFLDRTWRMHPALTRAVSDLSYDGALTTHAAARSRTLDGITPGLHVIPVRHIGRTDASAEEAQEVVSIVRSLLGRPWRSGSAAPARPMTEGDVIVVAPYNAQVEAIARVLNAAGLPDVEVGTVDRFQGREAPVAIYSATVSSLALRPQAADFVLGRNRLNVAISRAQWAAFIVHATTIADFQPRGAKDVAALSRFLRLEEFAVNRPQSRGARPERPAAS